MVLLDGKKLAALREQHLKRKAQDFEKKYGCKPGLCVILVGENPASHVYVSNKIKACERVGLHSTKQHLPAQTTQVELLSLVASLSRDPNIHGLLVQLPLPDHLQSESILQAIDPMKDVDCLTFENMGRLLAGRPRVAPCTPQGVMVLLQHHNLDVQGRVAVVVGRSEIVGRPMAQLLLKADATVTVCHSKTPDLRAFTSRADVVVVAAGRSRFLGRADFKADAIVVDVGIHRTEKGLCGDVRFEELDGWAQAATPVPGGVGPMTIAMLLENTLRLAELQLKGAT